MAVAIVLMIALIPWSKSSLVTVRNATSPCISSNPLDATPYQPCQSRIRLTPSFADSCGAVWSTQSVPVDSSFQITFSFQVSNITGYCPDHMNIYERCAKRGGHGLALIIQHDPSATNLASFIGGCQEGLGYTGIRNSVAIEFDMWHDAYLSDLYDNHIAVQTMGDGPNTNDHHQIYAGTADIPELADGDIHRFRFVYEPTFDINILQSETCSSRLACGLYQASPLFASMLTKSYSNVATMGSGWLYLDDMSKPLTIMPVNLISLLNLTSNQAYLGISASTGSVQFQTHDIFNWTFCSNSLCTQLTP